MAIWTITHVWLVFWSVYAHNPGVGFGIGCGFAVVVGVSVVLGAAVVVVVVVFSVVVVVVVVVVVDVSVDVSGETVVTSFVVGSTDVLFGSIVVVSGTESPENFNKNTQKCKGGGYKTENNDKSTHKLSCC